MYLVSIAFIFHIVFLSIHVGYVYRIRKRIRLPYNNFLFIPFFIRGRYRASILLDYYKGFYIRYPFTPLLTFYDFMISTWVQSGNTDLGNTYQSLIWRPNETFFEDYLSLTQFFEILLANHFYVMEGRNIVKPADAPALYV